MPDTATAALPPPRRRSPAEMSEVTSGSGASILVVSPSSARQGELAALLEAEGFSVSQTADAGLSTAAISAVDLILIEGRPFDEGVRRLCQVSAGGEGALIVLMTDRPDPVEEIVALELGADDLICRSADPRLLMARIRALLRRRSTGGAPPLDQNQWRLNALSRHAINPQGDRIRLSPSDMVLFDVFLSRPGEIIDPEYLKSLGHWEEEAAIRTAVSRLRRRLEGRGGRQFILTLRGAGYVFHGAGASLDSDGRPDLFVS